MFCKALFHTRSRSWISIQKQLVGTIKALVPHENRRPFGDKYRTKTSLRIPKPRERAANLQIHDDRFSYKGKPEIIIIGSSTGGPKALFKLIEDFKGFDVPIVITQHMPPTFTKILADHIEKNTGIPTHEGEEGMIIEAGHIYIAPGGLHMKFRKGYSGKVMIKLDDSPPVNFCKPSVDPMFNSAIEIFGKKAFGIILTGMGNDGLKGSQNLVEKGGRLIAQDEETSVVWGMPGAVANAGLCSEILPIDKIGPRIRKTVMG